ncbi:SPW repeat protein [Bradyrhizobium sp. Ash2021]|uniref:SPW repeat protein n=1 Tax=Bradyrhizobium sp. Ash2021 TaxID=2954771 RepID=UPI002815372E|nr:SPW repeat protein [Bradyrhizobium sp. Ash2021]WMT79674.1 SPW repeat protein [Bradyrhizobium sp. Ash2021]
MRIQHWQDIASLLLGVWLVMSPFVLGFAGAATWVTIVLGLFVILFAVEGFVDLSFRPIWRSGESFSSVWLSWLHLGQSATSRYWLR